MSKILVGAPFLAEFHSGALQLAVILLQFGFKSCEESECVGGRAGEPRDDFLVVEPPNFSGARFHDGFVKSYLPITGYSDVVVSSNCKNCGAADPRSDPRVGTLY